MAKNNLGQPTISDVVTLFCDPCNAVLCAGCPVNDILQAENAPNTARLLMGATAQAESTPPPNKNNETI